MSEPTGRITFRFYADLNDFLPLPLKQVTFTQEVNSDQSVKHLIEAIGVPHTEVEAILVNGEPADFARRLQAEDRVSVFPAFATLSLPLDYQLRPPLPSPPRFILDNHLGRLARYLRLLGFDALYPDDDYSDADLARHSHETRRVLLTRDRGLLKRSLVVYGYCLRTRHPREQLTAVIQRYQLQALIRPWRRCLRCNGVLEPVAKEAILAHLEPKTIRYYHEFHQCQRCRQVYWKGSHYDRLQALITSVIAGY